MNDDREITDPALGALLRAHSAESPPAHVDAAILAAAHRAVASAPHASRTTHAWRWWMPLAAAAAIGVVVVGILPLSPAIVDESSPVATDAPAGAPPVASKRDAAAGAGASADPTATLPDAGNARLPRPATPATTPPPKRELERETPAAAARTEAPRDRPGYEILRAVPQPPAAVAPAEAPAAPGVTSAPGFASPPRARGGLPEDALSVHRRDALATSPQTADEWIARIRALRSTGNEPDALRALAGFRQAFTDADARLPADLRDWAAASPRSPK